MKHSIKLTFICAGMMSLMPACNTEDTTPDPVVVTDDGIYTVSFSASDQGSAVATFDGEEITEAVAGTIIVITATPGEDYKFHEWGSANGNVTFASATSQTTIFTMPAEDVTLTPRFVETIFVSDGGYFGAVTFFTAEQWSVGNQIWSDVVTAARCKKNDFDGGSEGPYKVDCRQSGEFGDLFSWEAVNLYHAELCPAGWRIPTRQDFFDLDVALGGQGSGGTGSEMDYYNVWQKYLSEWGARPAGYARTENPDVVFPGAVACYWTQTELDPGHAFYLYVYSGRVYPQYNQTKDLGMSIRCVTETYRP